MRTCDFCGKNIDHKRADAKFCDGTCRSKHGQGLRLPKTKPASNSPAAADVVYGDLATALSHGADAAVPERGELDTDSVSSSRPPREPPVIHRPPMEHAREPDLDTAALEKRLFELELRMNAYDLEQPWQDWYSDAKKLVDEARKLVERAKQGETGVQERVEHVEKKLADGVTRETIASMIDEKLRHVWKEIDRVDNTTASRQSVEKLGDQVRALLGMTGGDGRLDSLVERMERLEASVAQLVRGHSVLRARGDKLAESMVSFARQVGQRLGIGVEEDD